jgi:hypothetical protein
MVCGANKLLKNMDRSDDDEERRRGRPGAPAAAPGSASGGRIKWRSDSQPHQHLLLMDCVGDSDNGDGASEETVPLPDYERLSQSARLPDYHDAKDTPPPLTPVQQQQTPAKREARSPPQPPPTQQQKPAEVSPPQPPPMQQQKPAAWRLLEYVRSRHRAGSSGAADGCGVGSDGDTKSSDGEREAEDGSEEGKKGKKKKRSSWLPDPDRRWPVQGFY